MHKTGCPYKISCFILLTKLLGYCIGLVGLQRSTSSDFSWIVPIFLIQVGTLKLSVPYHLLKLLINHLISDLLEFSLINQLVNT